VQSEGLVDNAAAMGAQLREGLTKVAADVPAIGDVRGLGLMLGNEFVDKAGDPDPAAAARVQQAAGAAGLLLLTCGAAGNVVRMIPPLVVNADQIDEGLTLWREAVKAV
jgi:4-aminobutyrate aminotransferase